MGEFVIAVDVGGTNIRAALLNEQLEIIKKETAFTADFPSADSFLEQLAYMIKKVDPGHEARCLGMALPAPWSDRNAVVTDITNVPCLEGLLVETICRRLEGYEISIENDVNVIALLESDRGAAREFKNSLYVTVSTGISSGIIINNKIYHGAHGYAGEIGSIIISRSRDGIFYNTLEEECSGMSLDEKSLSLYGRGSNARQLFVRYEDGDSRAAEIVTDWVDALTTGLTSVIQTMDPEIVVLGGSVVLKHKWVIDTLRQEVAKKVLGQLAGEIRFTEARFGLEAGLLGAGYYALSQKKSST